MAKVKLEDLKYVGLKVQEKEEVVAETAVAEPEAEPVIEEKITEGEIEHATPAATEIVDPVVLKVNNLRIYSIPSTKVPARSFTGNVVLVGHVDKFAAVEYVRAGFGKVKGYVIDTELPRS